MSVKLREIAHSRTGDKGNTSNISVIAYDAKHYPLLLAQVTQRRVKAHFAGVVEGEVVRYELPNLAALNFVMTQALGGGVTRSLALDAHGKSLSSALLDLDIEPAFGRQITAPKRATRRPCRTSRHLPHSPPISTAARTSARKLVEECLAKIADPRARAQRAFIHVDKEARARGGGRDGPAAQGAMRRRRRLPASRFRSRICSTSRGR